MNVAQVWSVIAIMAAGLGTMITLTFRYVGARFDTVDERFTRIDERFTRIDERFTRIDERFTGIDEHFTGIDEHFRSLEKKMDDRFDILDRDLQRVIERVFR
jgi:hypothetical protein